VCGCSQGDARVDGVKDASKGQIAGNVLFEKETKGVEQADLSEARPKVDSGLFGLLGRELAVLARQKRYDGSVVDRWSDRAVAHDESKGLPCIRASSESPNDLAHLGKEEDEKDDGDTAGSAEDPEDRAPSELLEGWRCGRKRHAPAELLAQSAAEDGSERRTALQRERVDAIIQPTLGWQGYIAYGAGADRDGRGGSAGLEEAEDDEETVGSTERETDAGGDVSTARQYDARRGRYVPHKVNVEQ
jgi:hypothetical protein